MGIDVYSVYMQCVVYMYMWFTHTYLHMHVVCVNVCGVWYMCYV